MTHTKYSNLTDEELLAVVSTIPAPDPLVEELAERMKRLIDTTSDAEEFRRASAYSKRRG